MHQPLLIKSHILVDSKGCRVSLPTCLRSGDQRQKGRTRETNRESEKERRPVGHSSENEGRGGKDGEAKLPRTRRERRERGGERRREEGRAKEEGGDRMGGGERERQKG